MTATYSFRSGGTGYRSFTPRARSSHGRKRYYIVVPTHEPKSGRITCRHKNRVISKHGRMGRIIGWTEVRLLPDISQSMAEVPKIDTKTLSLEKNISHFVGLFVSTKSMIKWRGIRATRINRGNTPCGKPLSKKFRLRKRQKKRLCRASGTVPWKLNSVIMKEKLFFVDGLRTCGTCCMKRKRQRDSTWRHMLPHSGYGGWKTDRYGLFCTPGCVFEGPKKVWPLMPHNFTYPFRMNYGKRLFNVTGGESYASTV